METKDKVLATMKEAGTPLNAGNKRKSFDSNERSR